MLQKFTCFTILVIFTWFLTKRNLVTDVLLFLLLLIRSWWAAQNFAVTAFCRARGAWPASYAPVSTVVLLEQRWWWLLRLRLRRQPTTSRTTPQTSSPKQKKLVSTGKFIDFTVLSDNWNLERQLGSRFCLFKGSKCSRYARKTLFWRYLRQFQWIIQIFLQVLTVLFMFIFSRARYSVF